MATTWNIWLQKLHDHDPAVRRQAIRQLEVIGDPGLLGPLAFVFARDPVLENRRLAQQVGKVIYYAALKRASDEQMASTAERERAARILEQAKARKKNRR